MDDEQARVDYENHLKEMFKYPSLSAEEYAARYSHCIGCFSLDRESYLDKEFEDWIKKLSSIGRDLDEIDRVRKKYLTEEEIKVIKSLGHEL